MGTGLRVIRGLAGEPPAGGFDVGYLDDRGVEQRRVLTTARSVRFEQVAPVRKIQSYKGQRHLPGRWWSATTGAHVGYESWLERDHVMLLDFDPLVVGIASQPFWLFWTGEDGRGLSHVPDYFVRRDDGVAIVVDCRPVERRGPRDVVKFAATERACALMGWEYRLVGAPDGTLAANIRWLSGYRHPRYRVVETAAALLEVFTEPVPVFDGAARVGDPIAVLPVLFHLLWCQEMGIELSMPFSARSLVWSRRRDGA